MKTEQIKDDKSKLFENAKISIKLGIEDYENSKTNKERSISSLRNLVAGILLLYKYKLFDSSPKEEPYKYISAHTENNENRPKKTVNVFQIKENLKKLSLEIDEVLLDELVENRNNIEHFFNLNENLDLMSLINDGFQLINQFYNSHLNKLGTVREFLGDETYEIFCKNEISYEKYKQQCKKTLNDIDFFDNDISSEFIEFIDHYARCPNCLSKFIKYKSGQEIDTRLCCDACHYSSELPDFFSLTHNEIRNGCDEPFHHCYECGGENALNGVCFDCGYIHDPDRDYEQEERLRYLMSKND